MYRVLLILPDRALAAKLRDLKVWGEASGFDISEITSEPFTDNEKYTGYELIIAESGTGLSLLRSLKKHRFRIVLCSADKDFETARQGLILGAYDYITEPFDETQVLAMLNRAESELSRKEVSDIFTADRITEFFDARDRSFFEYLDGAVSSVISSSVDSVKASVRLRTVFERVWEDISTRYQWCDLYMNEAMFRLIDAPGTFGSPSAQSARLSELFTEFCELYPPHNEQLDSVITEILNYPEGDLRQKKLSADLHINNTYLSTVFLAQTGVRFVDYVNTVKLKRAAWLLINTQLGVAEIAGRLDYRDNSYFSKLFRAKYGVSPSIFRLPQSYDFQI
ncbi:MAG: helix-turn-helix domain-containing protein [Ruminiclostridium sp.]|nr:helix-turn-helix domain-containing protein [Ruminiclostridium sp.]